MDDIVSLSVSCCGLACLLFLTRLAWLLLSRPQRVHLVNKHDKVKVLAVLGSGGHTTEMLRILNTLDRDKYSPIVFVIAATDNLGPAKAKSFDSNAAVFVIPRSREVGQPWISRYLLVCLSLTSSLSHTRGNG